MSAPIAAASPERAFSPLRTGGAGYAARRDPLVWVLALAALAVQILYTNLAATELIIGDQEDYLNIGHHFLDWWSMPVTSLRMPGYPLLLSFAFGAGLTQGAVQVGQAILLALCVPLVASLAARLGGAATARVSAVLFAAYVPLLSFSATYLTESVAIPLAIATVAAGLRAMDAKRQRWTQWTAITAVLVAFGYLVRVNTLVVAVPVVLGLLLVRRRPGQLATTAVIVLAAFCLALGPWVSRNQALYHQPLPTGTAGIYPTALGVHLPMDREVGKFASARRSARFWSGSRPDGFTPAVAAVQDNWKVLGDNVFHHTREFVITRAVGQYQLWAWPVTGNTQYGINDVPYGPVMVLHLLIILVGLAGFWRFRRRRLVRVSIGAVALTAAMHLVTFPQPRYVLPVMPLLMVAASPVVVAAAGGARRAAGRVGRTRRASA